MTETGPSPPLVVKIGGGLLRAGGLDGLRRATSEVRELARDRPVLVVPGGGPFADAVRALDAQVGLADDLAHALALRAMDQFGVLLADLLTDAEILPRLIAPRGLAVLESEPAFRDRPEVPRRWSVTSDALAVLAAAAIGAPEAILLKPVAGVLVRWPSEEPPLATLSADALAALQGRGGGRVVDAYLPEAVRLTGVSVVVRAPGGVGTRIAQG